MVVVVVVVVLIDFFRRVLRASFFWGGENRGKLLGLWKAWAWGPEEKKVGCV